MSALVATQKVSPGTFGTPQHAGAGVAYTPPSAAAKPAASPAAIKEAIVERSAQNVVADLKRIFGKEIAEAGEAVQQSKPLPGSIVFTHGFLQPDGTTNSMSIAMRPAKLLKEHVLEVADMSGSKRNCFNSILNRCFAKITDTGCLGLAFQLKDCEGLTLKTFTDSKLVRSFAYRNLLNVPEKGIVLF
jgi:hypothetical protein